MNYYALDEALMYLDNDNIDMISMLEKQVASVIELANDSIFEEFEVVYEMNVLPHVKIQEFLKKILEKIKALITKAAYAVANFGEKKIWKKIQGKSIPDSVETLSLYDIKDENFEKDWDKFCKEYNESIDDFNKELESDNDDKDKSYINASWIRFDIREEFTEFKEAVDKVAKNKVDVKITSTDPTKFYWDYVYTISFDYNQLLNTYNKISKEIYKLSNKSSLDRYCNNAGIGRGLPALTSIGFNMLKMGMSNALTILKACK